MKRYAMLLLVLIILMFTLPTNAQDDTPAPTDEVTATEETAATEELPIATVTESDFVTPTDPATATPNEVTSTPEPTAIIIVITQAPDDVPPVDPAPDPAPVDHTVEILVALAIVVIVLVDKISGYFLSQRLAALVPPEFLNAAGVFAEQAQTTGLRRAYERVKATPEEWDDNILVEGARIVGWEFITNPDGSVTPQRIKPSAQNVTVNVAAPGTPAS